MNKVIIVTLLLFWSCNTTENNNKVEKKKAEVMEIHDVAMEKMSEMAKLKNQLKQRLNTDSTNKDALNLAIKNLEEADEVMWDWMHNYHHEIVDTSHVDSAMKYLEKQYQDVLIVEKKINSSLKNGKALL